MSEAGVSEPLPICNISLMWRSELSPLTLAVAWERNKGGKLVRLWMWPLIWSICLGRGAAPCTVASVGCCLVRLYLRQLSLSAIGLLIWEAAADLQSWSENRSSSMAHG